MKILTEKLNQNSRNSHKPPSSDPPGAGAKSTQRDNQTGRRKSGRKRGGQRGHKGHHRQLVPPEQVDDFVDSFPNQCNDCFASLPQVNDPDASRYQVTEVPPVIPHITEYRLHAVTCTCGHRTRASEDTVPASPFGPRLHSLVALLTGVYHLSRRKACTLLSDMVGVRISVGAVSNVEARVSEAVKPAVEQAWEQAKFAKVKHTDSTGWLCVGKTMALWVIATAAVTVYKIVSNGSQKTLRPLFGSLKGISDRASVLTFWAMERRQICWAHLIRKFVALARFPRLRDDRRIQFRGQCLDRRAVSFPHRFGDNRLCTTS